MSPTETLMLIALGFALALVLVLLIGRGIWNMAMRLGARRHAKHIPTAMLELQADRDRLRAEHAMMSRKLELRLEDIKTRMTEQMAEVSRHRNRVQSMKQDLDKRDETLMIRDREVGALNSQLEVNKADLDSCYDTIKRLSTDIEAKETELTRQTNVINQLSNNLREKSHTVTNLGQELETALRIAPKKSKNANPDNRLLQRVAELTSISTQMNSQRDASTYNANTTINLNEMPATEAAIETLSRQSSLDQHLAETERETQAMSEQLKALDLLMAPTPMPTPEPQQKKPGPMANVISLAQRIRALQKGVEG